MLSSKLLSSIGNIDRLDVDDVFSAYTYTGNGSTQTINNGIDLAGEGGLVWIKGRSGATDHALYDTARGATLGLVSNSTAGQITQSTGLTAFENSGFSVGSLAKLNTNSSTYASWTFRKAPKFFDIVTWTGNNIAARTIPHALNGPVGMIMLKKVVSSESWWVVHRSAQNGFTSYGTLNTTSAQSSGSEISNVSDTSFDITTYYNGTEVQWIAYLFASLPGISKEGSYTGNGSSQTINCGFSTGARFVLIKRTDSTGDWYVWDTARGLVADNDPHLSLNTPSAEVTTNDSVDPDGTGFIVNQVTATNINVTSATYLYLAIA